LIILVTISPTHHLIFSPTTISSLTISSTISQITGTQASLVGGFTLAALTSLNPDDYGVR